MYAYGRKAACEGGRWGTNSCAHEASSIGNVASVTMDDFRLQHLSLRRSTG